MPSRRTKSCSSSSSTASTSSTDTNSRQLRNQAEKQRRDKLNNYINELAMIVPMVSKTTKRLDKTSILRLTAAHLRLHYSSLNVKNNKRNMMWRPNSLRAVNVDEILSAIDGFLIATTLSGKIMFVSQSVETYLGHQDIEMIGHSLLSFIHPADTELVLKELKVLITSLTEDKNVAARSSFCARVKERSQPRSEILGYQTMSFNCCVSLEEGENIKSLKFSTATRPNRPFVRESLSFGLVKFFVKPVTASPNNELSITEALLEEYVTRHDISGKILFVDHRISTITGHLPHEVTGKTAYDYILHEDIPVTQFAQRLMFSSSNGMGMIVYRLKTRNSTFVYLKTSGHLQYDKSNKNIIDFVCINKLLSEEEGKEELKKFTDRYIPKIKSEKVPTLQMITSSPSSADPCQIELSQSPALSICSEAMSSPCLTICESLTSPTSSYECYQSDGGFSVDQQHQTTAEKLPNLSDMLLSHQFQQLYNAEKSTCSSDTISSEILEVQELDSLDSKRKRMMPSNAILPKIPNGYVNGMNSLNYKHFKYEGENQLPTRGNDTNGLESSSGSENLEEIEVDDGTFADDMAINNMLNTTDWLSDMSLCSSVVNSDSLTSRISHSAMNTSAIPMSNGHIAMNASDIHASTCNMIPSQTFVVPCDLYELADIDAQLFAT